MTERHIHSILKIEAVYAANYGINYDLYRKKLTETTPITYIKPEPEDPEEPGETTEADGKLLEILDIVYDGVESPETGKAALTPENEKYYLGVTGLDCQSRSGKRCSDHIDSSFRRSDRDERRCGRRGSDEEHKGKCGRKKMDLCRSRG